MKTILFLANAGPEVGMGHLNRCRALAFSLVSMKAICIMIGPSTSYKTKEDLIAFTDWYELGSTLDEDGLLNGFIDIKNKINFNRIVIDDYRVKSAFQKYLFDKGYKWLQFDIADNKPIWSNWIHNASPSVNEKDYDSNLMGHNQIMFLGPEYALLHPKYFDNFYSRIELRDFKKVFVSFGGGNDRGAISFILNSLHNYNKNIHYEIVSSKFNQNNDKIKNLITSKWTDKANFHISPENINDIMIDCDFCIIGGGTMTFEAAKCGLPMIIITIAKNQIKQAKGWESIGVAKYVGELKYAERSVLRSTIHEYLNRKKLKQIRKVLNGMQFKGADYISKIILYD